jgi:SAM-dependent methyltransferase
MNKAHRWFCRSRHWQRVLEQRLIPWALDGWELGTNVLEIGPGPGLTTDCLCRLVPRLTCLEIDEAAASSLSLRLAGENVRVICGDGTALPLPEESFDAVVCFTMLHHVGSVGLQDQLLTEAARVLRPGGTFAGVDSLGSPLFRLFHLFDTMVLIDPNTFPHRLRAAGFTNPQVDVVANGFRFRAQKPASSHNVEMDHQNLGSSSELVSGIPPPLPSSAAWLCWLLGRRRPGDGSRTKGCRQPGAEKRAGQNRPEPIALQNNGYQDWGAVG